MFSISFTEQDNKGKSSKYVVIKKDYLHKEIKLEALQKKLTDVGCTLAKDAGGVYPNMWECSIDELMNYIADLNKAVE